MMALAMISSDKVLTGYNEICVDAEPLPDASLRPLLSYFENSGWSILIFGMCRRLTQERTTRVRVRLRQNAF